MIRSDHSRDRVAAIAVVSTRLCSPSLLFFWKISTDLFVCVFGTIVTASVRRTPEISQARDQLVGLPHRKQLCSMTLEDFQHSDDRFCVISDTDKCRDSSGAEAKYDLTKNVAGCFQGTIALAAKRALCSYNGVGQVDSELFCIKLVSALHDVGFCPPCTNRPSWFFSFPSDSAWSCRMAGGMARNSGTTL